MATKFPVFPRLLPGETLQSAASRLAVSLNLRKREEWSALLALPCHFDTWSRQILMPAHVAAFSRLLPEYHPQKSVDTLINEHTLFPALTYFAPHELRQDFRSRYSKDGDRQNISSKLGMTRWKIRDESISWAYCDQCVHDDIRQYHASYYHREHQFPSAYVCWIHGCTLRKTCSLCAGKLIGAICPPPSLIDHRCQHQADGSLTKTLPVGLSQKEALQIAKAIAHICTVPPRLSMPMWADEMAALLHKIQPDQNNLAYDRIASGLEERFGHGLVDLLASRQTSQGHKSWIVKSLSHHFYGQHPLARILLTLFVSPSLKQFEEDALADSRADAMPRFCADSWSPEWIHDCRHQFEKGHRPSDLANAFSVSKREVCIYMARMQAFPAPRHLHPSHLARAAELIRQGEPISKVGKRFRIRTDCLLQELAKIDLGFTQQVAETLFSNKQDRYRAQVGNAIARGYSATDLHSKFSTAMLWLKRYDSAWLSKTTEKIHPRPVPMPPRRPILDNDLHCAERVDIAAEQIKRIFNYPRITSSSLFHAAGLSSMIRKYPDCYIHTHRAILSHVESTASFGTRQLECVIQELANSEFSVLKSEIIARYQVPECLKSSRDDLITAFAAKHGLHVIDLKSI